MIDAIAWKFQTGSQWVHLPERYRVFTALMAQADAAEALDWAVSVDSTVVRTHQHAAGARKKGPRPASRTTTPSAGPAAD